MGTSEVSACLFHRAPAALSVAAALFLPSRMGCNSWDGAVTGGFAQVSCVMPASWQRVFFFFVRGGGFSPKTSPRPRWHPEETDSPALVVLQSNDCCHDATVSKHDKKTQSLVDCTRVRCTFFTRLRIMCGFRRHEQRIRILVKQVLGLHEVLPRKHLIHHGRDVPSFHAYPGATPREVMKKEHGNQS